jgi:hypothetical protein
VQPRGPEPPGLSLRLRAPVGCPPLVALRELVAEHLGEGATRAPALRVDLVVWRVAGKWLARLDVRGAAGGRRELEGGTCREVIDAAALVIALAVENDGHVVGQRPLPMVLEGEPELGRTYPDLGAVDQSRAGPSIRGKSAPSTLESGRSRIDSRSRTGAGPSRAASVPSPGDPARSPGETARSPGGRIAPVPSPGGRITPRGGSHAAAEPGGRIAPRGGPRAAVPGGRIAPGAGSRGVAEPGGRIVPRGGPRAAEPRAAEPGGRIARGGESAAAAEPGTELHTAAEPGTGLQAAAEPGGDLRAAEQGDLRAAEQGDLRATEQGDLRAAEQGDLRATEQGDLRAAEQGDLRGSAEQDSRREPAEQDGRPEPAAEYDYDFDSDRGDQADPSKRQAIGASLRAGGAGESGTLPQAAAGVEAALAVWSARHRLELSAAYWPAQAARVGPGQNGAMVGLWTSAVRGCRTLSIAALCGGGEIGRMTGRAMELPDRRDGGAWWGALSGSVWLRRPIGRAAFYAGLEGLLPVTRPRFELDDETVLHRPGPVAGRAMLGLELSLF